MSREIFLAAARVHAGRAVSQLMAICQRHTYMSAVVGPYIEKGAEQEADIALAWLALADKEHPGLLAAEEHFAEQRELGLQQEIASERTRLTKVWAIAQTAIANLPHSKEKLILELKEAMSKL